MSDTDSVPLSEAMFVWIYLLTKNQLFNPCIVIEITKQSWRNDVQ